MLVELWYLLNLVLLSNDRIIEWSFINLLQTSMFHLFHLLDMLIDQRLWSGFLCCIYNSHLSKLSLYIIELVSVNIQIVVFKLIHVVLASLSILVYGKVLLRNVVEWWIILIRYDSRCIWHLNHVADPSVVTVLLLICWAYFLVFEV